MMNVIKRSTVEDIAKLPFVKGSNGRKFLPTFFFC